MADGGSTATVTLRVTNVPERIGEATIEALFSAFPSFLSARKIPDAFLITYGTKKDADVAKRKLHGHKFSEGDAGLDVTLDSGGRGGKGGREGLESQRYAQLVSQQLTGCRLYGCSACGEGVLYLDPDGALEDQPMRKSEPTRCIHEGIHLRGLFVCRGEPVEVALEDGKVERRFPLLCPECDCILAYRSTPLGTLSPDHTLYIPEGALGLREVRVHASDPFPIRPVME